MITRRAATSVFALLTAGCATTTPWAGSTERLAITSPKDDLEAPQGFPMVRAPVWAVGESILDCVEQYRGQGGPEDHAVEVRLQFSAGGIRASVVQSRSDADGATSRCVEQVLGTYDWRPSTGDWPVRVIQHPLPGDH